MAQITEEKIIKLPVLALRALVILPGTVLSFDVGRKKSANALKYAMEHNQPVFAVTQKEVFEEYPHTEDLYDIGCVVKVRQILKISENVVKVLVEGLYRAKYFNFIDNGNFLSADTVKIEDTPIKNRPIYIESLLRRVKNQFEKYAEVFPNISTEVVLRISETDNLGFLSDFIASNISAPYDDKQYVLEQADPVKRAKILIELLDKEREIGEIDRRINEKTRAAIDENQREYYLKEQIRAISTELYGDDSADEIDEYRYKVDSLDAEQKIKSVLYTQVNKLAKMPSGSHEGTVVRNYLDTCLELPWNKLSSTNTDILKAEKILNRDIYGMDKVKERILEMLSVYSLAPDIKGQIICLVGPPGVGKTSIGKTIAECMGRKFSRISLGGVHDEAEIRGHRKTYIGAMSGKIIDAVKQAGTANPLILLDEIDKLGNDYR